MYPKIADWDDSGGKEAFLNAKARYWAHINNLSCPVPLPEPDMYIDSVDHDGVLDPKLVEDLYKQPMPSQEGEGESGIIWGSFQFREESVPVSGWGNEENGPSLYANDQPVQIQPTGWGDEDDIPPLYSGQSIQPSGWEEVQPTGWGDEDYIPTPYTGLSIQASGWGREEDPFSAIYTTDQTFQIQPTGWDDTENSTKDILKDNYVNNMLQWDLLSQNQKCGDYEHKGKGPERHGGSQMTAGSKVRKKANCAKGKTVSYGSQWELMPAWGPNDQGGSANFQCALRWRKSVS